MAEPVYVGIDCGDLEPRAAVWADGAARPVAPGGPPRPTLYFDPNGAASGLGVGFPGVLRSVGVGLAFHAPGMESPESLATAALGDAHKAVRTAAAAAPGPTALAVPAGLTQARRRALLDCARAAGFDAPTLVDKCTAAAFGRHAAGDKPMTAVVVDVGYGPGEFALVRLARGRCRVLAAGLFPHLSGEWLDAVVMEAVVLALRRRREFLGLKQFTPAQWMEFRRLAESARRALEEYPEAEVTLLPGLTGMAGPRRVRLYADRFADRVRPAVGQVVEEVRGALDRNRYELTDVDAFLLTGAAAQAPPVRDVLVAEFGGRPEAAGADLVAAGAAGYARQFDQGVIDGGVPAGEADPVAGPVADRPAPPTPAVEVAEVVGDPEAAEKPAAEDPLAAARRLIGEGRRAEAESLLAAVVREAEGLLADLRQPPPTDPQRWVEQAAALVAAGQIQHGIDLAHKAHAAAPNDAAVFRGMMKAHADAGLALDRPEQYTAAIQILNCAHGHDQTDRSIHQALAARHYLHARVMVGLNNPAGAAEAAHLAQRYDPHHAGADQILRQLETHPPADGPPA